VLKINQIRMRSLESMIAQFVDDLLQTIREATIEDLRELLLAEPQNERASQTPQPPETLRTAPARIGRVTPIERRVTGPSVDFSNTPPSVAEITDPESLLSLGGAQNGSSSSPRNGVREVAPPGPAQTFWLDSAPASLAARASRIARSARTDLATAGAVPAPESGSELEAEGPASDVRPVGGSAPVRLSDNETLARVSNSGIVIRRRKKA
jgi:hypothetical protein